MKRAITAIYLVLAALGGWLAGGPPVSPPAEALRSVAAPPPPSMRAALPSIAQLVRDASPDNALHLRQRIGRMNVDEVLAALDGAAKDLADLSTLEARAVRALADRLAALDLDAVWQARTRFPQFSGLLVAAAGAALGAKHPADAARWASRLGTDADDFWTAFGGAVDADAFATLQLPPEAKSRARLALAERLMQTDEHATEALGREDPRVLVALAPGLARRDPEAALAWLDTFPKSASAVTARHAIYETWAAQDLPAALRAFEASGLASRIRLSAWAEALHQWPATDVLAALEQSPTVATTEGDDNFRSSDLAGFWFRYVCFASPSEAATLLAQSRDSALHSSLLYGAARTWQNSDASLLQPLAEAEPAAFFELLPRLEPATQEALRPVIMKAWRTLDPAAAARAQAAEPAK